MGVRGFQNNVRFGLNYKNLPNKLKKGTHIHSKGIKIFLCPVCALFFILQISAQDSIVDQDVRVNEQIWVDYNFKNTIRDTIFVSTQVGFRTISPQIYNRYLAISTLNLRAKRWFKMFQKDKDPLIRSYHIGAGTIYTRNFNDTDNFELRFIQGVKFIIPTLLNAKIYNYTRLEERFQTAFDGNGWESGFRLRHRAFVMISWKKHYLNFTEGLYFPLAAEVFLNLKRSDRFNDLVRLAPGIGYKFESGLRMELYAIYNRSKNTTETNDSSNDFILRLRIFGNPVKDLILAPANEFEETEDAKPPN